MNARDRFVDAALGEVGKPYSAHRDCSGFVAWAGRQAGIALPEGSVAQYRVARALGPNEPSQPADLHFWDTFGPAPGHVAIDVGGGLCVHALNEQRGIVTSTVAANMGGPYMGARRIFSDMDVAPTVTGSEPSGQRPDSSGASSGSDGGPNPSASTTRDRDRQRRKERDRARRRRRRG